MLLGLLRGLRRNEVDFVPVACGDVLRMTDLHIGPFVFCLLLLLYIKVNRYMYGLDA